MSSRKTPTCNVNGRRKELVAMPERAMPAHGSRRDFFRDCVELWAITVSNQLAGGYKYDEREQRYLNIVKRYDAETINGIAQAFGLFQIVTDDERGDVLGDVYMGLAISNENNGQFFTPTTIATMMNAMVFADSAADLVAERRRTGEPVRVHDPAVGAGSMLLAGADLLDERGIEFRDIMEFSGVDVDLTCVHMTYLQLATRGVAAIVHHGNSLSMEMWDTWYTPLYAQQYAARTNRLLELAAAEPVAIEQRTVEQLTLDLAS